MDTKTKATEEYEISFKKDYMSDWDVHKGYIQTFDAYEAMLIGQVYDSVSGSVDGSKITDSYASTLAIERAARVMGKLPEGETEATAKADQGKAAFMDILRQKWIYPNANAQHNFETKLRLWQLYSSVYGYMPMFYDWNVSPTGYVGPDCWLWNPRNLVPQQGKTSIKDMEYVTALTWVGKKYLEDIRDDVSGKSEGSDETENKEELGGWDLDALNLLIEKADAKQDKEEAQETKISRDRTNSSKKGICLATRYEAGDDGEWCTFAPDHSYIEVRRLKNPHKNGRIPFVIKYSQPLFDSFYGLGDFQRAKPLQFARDGLTNFYFKGIKMNIIPPIVANANGVLKHTLDYREGAVMMETIPNSIRRLETSNAGLATYQAAQTSLTGSLLSLYGSQNASIPGADALNPSQGKTPAAIDLYSGKEADRDGQERMYLEGAIEELTDGFFSLLVNIGTEDIPVNLFSDDIEDIAKAGLKDILQLFPGAKFSPNSTQTGGELRINPDSIRGVEYRFNINRNSTAKVSKEAQLKELERFVQDLSGFQNLFQDDPRITVNVDKIASAFGELADIKNADEFITVTDGPDPHMQEMQQQLQQLQQENDQLKKSPPPSQTAVGAPTGQVHESADLVKLYQATADEGLRSQIVKALGFEPTATTVTTGHTYQDPEIAQAAQALAPEEGQAPEQPGEPQEPQATVNKGGAYQDQTVGAAADQITKM